MSGAGSLSAFDAAVKGWFAAVEMAAAEAAVGLAHNAFEEILETGPQYSGDFVANTKVSMTGSANTGFQEGLGGAPLKHPTQRGNPAAQATARALANWTVPKLGIPIIISSTAKHDDNYAWRIENGDIKFRPVNEGADHVYRRAAAVTQHKYATIGKVALAELRKKTL